MTKMTSASANKVIRKLHEDKEFWLRKENEGYTYVVGLDEEPVIPEYDYRLVADEIAEIDNKIAIIKHTINVVNSTNEIEVGDKKMSIDTILIKMAQLNKRKLVLDRMRKMQPKTRLEAGMLSSRKAVPEYLYIKFKGLIKLVKRKLHSRNFCIYFIIFRLHKL